MKIQPMILYFVFLVVVFVAGIIIAPTNITKTETKVITECTQLEDWKQLKEIDDRGFEAAYTAFGLAGQMMDALEAGESGKFKVYNDKFHNNTDVIVKVGMERQSILKRLGY